MLNMTKVELQLISDPDMYIFFEKGTWGGVCNSYRKPTTSIQSLMTLKKNKKNGDKDGKALYKLMNNNAYEKTMENMRNRIDVKLVSYKKILF